MPEKEDRTPPPTLSLPLLDLLSRPGALTFNYMEAIRDAAIADLGIGYMPDFLACPASEFLSSIWRLHSFDRTDQRRVGLPRHPIRWPRVDGREEIMQLRR